MNMYKRTRYLIVGDKGLSVEFGNAMSEAINLRVQKLWVSLREARLPGMGRNWSSRQRSTPL